MFLGVPPTKFSWSYRDKNNKVHEYKDLTPQEFNHNIVRINFQDYITIMNNPCKEFKRTYIKENSASLIESSENMRYLNLSNADIQSMIITSLRANKPICLLCDCNYYKLNYRLDIDNHNFDKLFNTSKLVKEIIINSSLQNNTHRIVIT